MQDNPNTQTLLGKSLPVQSHRYENVIGWAEALQVLHSGIGKAIPNLKQLIVLNALAWDGGGDKNKTISPQ